MSNDISECLQATGHRWETIEIEIAGRGSLTTYAIEQCDLCDGVRINHDVELLGEVNE